MSDPNELALAKSALNVGIGGCVEWKLEVVARVRAEMARHGLTLEEIRSDLIQHVRAGGVLTQIKEVRDGWKDRRDYWYKVIVPMPDLFVKGLFVELELVNRDPELPEVRLVNAHEQI